MNAEILQHRSGRTGRAGRKGISVLVVPQARFHAEVWIAALPACAASACRRCTSECAILMAGESASKVFIQAALSQACDRLLQGGQCAW